MILFKRRAWHELKADGMELFFSSLAAPHGLCLFQGHATRWPPRIDRRFLILDACCCLLKLLDLGHAHHALAHGVHGAVGARVEARPGHVVPDLDPDHLLHHQQELRAERRCCRLRRREDRRGRRLQLERQPRLCLWRRHLRRSWLLLMYLYRRLRRCRRWNRWGWFGLLVQPWQGEGQRQGGRRRLLRWRRRRRRPRRKRRRHREHDHAARARHGAVHVLLLLLLGGDGGSGSGSGTG